MDEDVKYELRNIYREDTSMNQVNYDRLDLKNICFKPNSLSQKYLAESKGDKEKKPDEKKPSILEETIKKYNLFDIEERGELLDGCNQDECIEDEKIQQQQQHQQFEQVNNIEHSLHSLTCKIYKLSCITIISCGVIICTYYSLTNILSGVL